MAHRASPGTGSVRHYSGLRLVSPVEPKAILVHLSANLNHLAPDREFALRRLLRDLRALCG
jgi:hypothetical protein